MKFDIWVFLENLSRKFKFHLNLARITGILYEDQYTFLSYLAQFFLASYNKWGREILFSSKSCRFDLQDKGISLVWKLKHWQVLGIYDSSGNETYHRLAEWSLIMYVKSSTTKPIWHSLDMVFEVNEPCNAHDWQRRYVTLNGTQWNSRVSRTRKNYVTSAHMQRCSHPLGNLRV